MAIVTAPSLDDLYSLINLAMVHTESEEVYELASNAKQWVHALQTLDAASTCKLAIETAETAKPIECILAISTGHAAQVTAEALNLGVMQITVYVHGDAGGIEGLPTYDW